MYVIVNYDTFQKCNEIFTDFISALKFWENNADINSVIEKHCAQTNSVSVVWDKSFWEYENYIENCEVIQ